MFCSHCQRTRIENAAPCPYCGAPSSLVSPGQGGMVVGGTWSDPLAQADSSFAEQWNYSVPQTSFDAPAPVAEAPQWSFNTFSPPQTPFNTPAALPGAFDAPAPGSQAPQWSVNALSPSQGPQLMFDAPAAQPPQWGGGWSDPGNMSFQQSPARSPEELQSFLPVPYQPMADLQVQGHQSTMSLQVIPQQMVEHLLPAMPETPDMVHIPQYYTKERPIVPRYRAISGLLSVIVVALLLCGGAGYYAQSSGMVSRVAHAMGFGTLPNVKTTAAKSLPAPQQPTLGPASGIIPSASTTAHFDPKNPNAFHLDTAFRVHQQFYVTCTVLPQNGNGSVIFKWYTNGVLYFASPPQTPKPNLTNNIYVTVSYPQAAEGAVAIYWRDQTGKDQLAEELYFVVQ